MLPGATVSFVDHTVFCSIL